MVPGTVPCMQSGQNGILSSVQSRKLAAEHFFFFVNNSLFTLKIKINNCWFSLILEYLRQN